MALARPKKSPGPGHAKSKKSPGQQTSSKQSSYFQVQGPSQQKVKTRSCRSPTRSKKHFASSSQGPKQGAKKIKLADHICVAFCTCWPGLAAPPSCAHASRATAFRRACSLQLPPSGAFCSRNHGNLILKLLNSRVGRTGGSFVEGSFKWSRDSWRESFAEGYKAIYNMHTYTNTRILHLVEKAQYKGDTEFLSCRLLMIIYHILYTTCIERDTYIYIHIHDTYI